jgi:hypothetical protein
MKPARLAIVVAVALIASTMVTVVLAGTGTVPFTNGPGTRSTVRNTPDGPDHVTVPDFPDATSVGAPVEYGEFELIPFGGKHLHEHGYAQQATGPVDRSATPEMIKASDLYSLPARAAAARATETLTALTSGSTVLEIHANYQYALNGTNVSVEVVRWRPQLPFDADLPVPNGAVSLTYGKVGNDDAIIYQQVTGDPYNDVWFIHDGILTQIAAAAPLSEVMSLAESMQ